ncbi:type II secretion system F family protein [Microbaculum marinisediminis]|uniref:Type II secretion system F family protein n=1 Tax=Microbaculum marinisediminis TaxID=2931392 RepID=A0AAW5R2C4_9HYPH|nr:type II secretion system F family protein [Microbaculum sp. A6E488]MCT8972695.1 type II secretion system F family protein [Microbaculum sp. A6E488]
MIDQIGTRMSAVLTGAGGEWVLLALAFAAAVATFLFASFLVLPRLETRRRIREQLLKKNIPTHALLAGQAEERARALLPLTDYYAAIEENAEPDSIRARLHRAGFYGPNAPTVFHLVRVGLWAGAFAVGFAAGRIFFPGFPVSMLFILTFIYSLLFLLLPSFVLDHMGRSRELAYRRAFPDFMDMMVVCTEAGLGLEAATEEVSEELASTNSALGLHLKVMTLEMRAGRTMREALHNLSRRINIEEARALAVLFQQSEELGTSLNEALRVYSAEMRDKRMMSAEEKANALPVKMVFPLGFCVFPVILVMVLAPVFIRMSGVFF